MMPGKELYPIPPNFAEEGTLFSGRIRTRNAVETAFFFLVLIQPLLRLSTPLKYKIYIGLIVILPVVILSIVGIQGQSLTAFVWSFLKFLKNKSLTIVCTK